MRRGCSLFLFILVLSGCSNSPVGLGGGLNTGELTFVNKADRPFAVLVFEREDYNLTNPAPAFSEAEFEARKIGVGSSDGHEYERGDDVIVLIYADCGCELSEQIAVIVGPNAKPIVMSFTLTADELERKDYRVTIDEL